MIAGVRVPVTTTAPKVGLALPVSEVVPENVMVLAVNVGAELLVRAPFTSIVLPLESSAPFKRSVPFTVMLLPSNTEPLPMVRLLSTEVEEGNSFPEVMLEPV